MYLKQTTFLGHIKLQLFYSYNVYENIIYLLTAIGLSPSGSSTAHIYTQKIHRTTQITTNLTQITTNLHK
jgi:uncharacterized integral membrane protein